MANVGQFGSTNTNVRDERTRELFDMLHKLQSPLTYESVPNVLFSANIWFRKLIQGTSECERRVREVEQRMKDSLQRHVDTVRNIAGSAMGGGNVVGQPQLKTVDDLLYCLINSYKQRADGCKRVEKEMEDKQCKFMESQEKLRSADAGQKQQLKELEAKLGQLMTEVPQLELENKNAKKGMVELKERLTNALNLAKEAEADKQKSTQRLQSKDDYIRRWNRRVSEELKEKGEKIVELQRSADMKDEAARKEQEEGQLAVNQKQKESEETIRHLQKTVQGKDEQLIRDRQRLRDLEGQVEQLREREHSVDNDTISTTGNKNRAADGPSTLSKRVGLRSASMPPRPPRHAPKQAEDDSMMDIDRAIDTEWGGVNKVPTWREGLSSASLNLDDDEDFEEIGMTASIASVATKMDPSRKARRTRKKRSILASAAGATARPSSTNNNSDRSDQFAENDEWMLNNS